MGKSKSASSHMTGKLRYEITVDLSPEDNPQHVYEMIEHLLFDLGEVGTLSMRSMPDDD